MKPKFVDLWNAYGKLLKNHGKKPCDQKWANQCAIRMSICLIKAGMPFDNYSEPKCKHGHARGAESLANWLWKNHLKPPKIYPKVKEAKTALKQSQGLIFFKNCFTRDGETARTGDHIDLWYKSKVMTYDDPKNHSHQVWFWEVK